MANLEKSHSTYDPSLLSAGGVDQETARIDEQTAMTWPKERAVLHGLGLGGAARVLEVGCGPGTVTRELCGMYPGSEIVAVDAHPGFAARARERCGERARVVRSASLPLPFTAGSFDLVVARYAFQHTTDPAALARELRRVLRTGGTLFTADVDQGLWGAIDPEPPDLMVAHRRTAEAVAARGNDRRAGRRLERLLRDAPLADVRLSCYPCTSLELGIDAFAPHLGPERLDRLAASGVIDEREHARALAGWDWFRSREDAYVMVLGFVATGTAGPGGRPDGR